MDLSSVLTVSVVPPSFFQGALDPSSAPIAGCISEVLLGFGVTPYLLESQCARSGRKIGLCLGGAPAECSECYQGLSKVWKHSKSISSIGPEVPEVVGSAPDSVDIKLKTGRDLVDITRGSRGSSYVQYGHRHSSRQVGFISPFSVLAKAPDSPVSYPSNQDDITIQVAGLWRLLNLLRCPTPYYHQFDGRIVKFKVYQVQGEKAIARAVVAYDAPGGARHNANNKHVLKARAAHNTARQLKAIVEKHGLGGLKACALDWTLPKSVTLACVKVSEETRRGFEHGWRELVLNIQASQIGLKRCERNQMYAVIGEHRHSTSTMEPLFHMETLVLNYRLVSGDPVEFRMIPYVEGPYGKSMPMSADHLERVKQFYRVGVVNLVRRHFNSKVLPGVDLELLVDDMKHFDWNIADGEGGTGDLLDGADAKRKMNVHIRVIDLSEADGAGWGQLEHHLAYSAKHFCQDGVRFAKKHVELDDTPPSWLMGFENHARTYGWAMKIGALSGMSSAPGEEQPEPDVSPFSGKELTYLGDLSVIDVTSDEYRIGTLERVGNRFFHGVVDGNCKHRIREAAGYGPESVLDIFGRELLVDKFGDSEVSEPDSDESVPLRYSFEDSGGDGPGLDSLVNDTEGVEEGWCGEGFR